MIEAQIFPYNDSQPGAIAALQNALVTAVARGRRVMLDLDHLPVLDNPAIRGLIMLLRRVREAGGELIVRVTRPELRNVLSVTALDRVFEVAAC
jgi:anti-anti-sigma factor